MELLQWILTNFGLFFGALFLFYIFLMIRRITVLYDYLRFIPPEKETSSIVVGKARSLLFLDEFFKRLSNAPPDKPGCAESIIDAIWSEVDCRVTVHFMALNGYINTLILIGFAGTIFGSIGAFNEMFQGLARGESAALVFAASWNNGLATALYTSLGAAGIGGILVTVLCSRFLMTRSKRLETMVGLRIAEVVEGRS